eukprot:scaffold649_cov347-Pavlova_lutheri.AAC.3
MGRASRSRRACTSSSPRRAAFRRRFSDFGSSEAVSCLPTTSFLPDHVFRCVRSTATPPNAPRSAPPPCAKCRIHPATSSIPPFRENILYCRGGGNPDAIPEGFGFEPVDGSVGKGKEGRDGRNRETDVVVHGRRRCEASAGGERQATEGASRGPGGLLGAWERIKGRRRTEETARERKKEADRRRDRVGCVCGAAFGLVLQHRRMETLLGLSAHVDRQCVLLP